MVRVVIRAAVFLGSAAVGLYVATLMVPEMSIGWRSFLVVVVVFAVLQSLLTPFITKTAVKNASALVGAAGLLSTVAALLITSVLIEGLSIRGGVGPWIYASVVVWIVTMVAALLLPLVAVKRGAAAAAERRRAAP
ncbi:phage holin family protein [Actinotalea sp. K2]|uniref:phage holin family protein n=1 Tax=Actinotalea sp. K2 TaxID=2939438 RepID=UPI002016BF1A|nr:phage holin family protein [Actinotalea sp. K2]MCL3861905.1 phage holin family protein [Actinotalea sp. K2]